MITVEVNGTPYDQFISIELGMSLPAIARDFSITVSQPDGSTLPFRAGDPIKIFVDGELRLDGSIFSVSGGYSKRTHPITMRGRSRVADLVDSSLLPFSIESTVSLKGAIEQVINQLGLSLRVINQINGLADFNPAEDKISAEAGDSAFQFIDTLARKRQVLLTSDPSGNIIITRNGTAQNPRTLFNPGTGADGNIMRAQFSYDETGRYNKTIVTSQKNPAAGFSAASLDPASVVNQRGEQIDTSIRTGRQLVMQSEKASSSAGAQERATWEANIRQVRSRRYTVIVQGLRPDGGDIWEPNRLQAVDDKQAAIREVMLIDSVRFSQSRIRGTITQLELVNRDAYSLSLAEPPPSQQEDNPFAGF